MDGNKHGFHLANIVIIVILIVIIYLCYFRTM